MTFEVPIGVAQSVLLRALQESAKRRAEITKDVADAMNMGDVSKELAATRKRSHLGRTLVKAGIALIAVPDPLSDLPGAAMVVAGVAISKYSDCAGLHDLKEEVTRTMNSLCLYL